MLYIELRRRQKRWSQKNLGDIARLHQYYISLIERGRGMPLPDEHIRLAQALDLPPDKLLQRVPDLIEPPAVAEVEVSR